MVSKRHYLIYSTKVSRAAEGNLKVSKKSTKPKAEPILLSFWVSSQLVLSHIIKHA